MNSFVIYEDANGNERSRPMTPEELEAFERETEKKRAIIRKYHGDFDGFSIEGDGAWVTRIRGGAYMREPMAPEARAEIEGLNNRPAEKMEITVPEEKGISATEARSLIGSMSGQIGALAEMLRVTNERMQALEDEVRSLGAAVRTLEKVTPQQAGRINKAIRERGLELCREYRIGVTVTPVVQGVGSVPEQARFEASAEKAKRISAAIRAEVRTMAGAKTAREVARCDYETVIGYVQAWEDYETIQRIRRG